MLVLMRRIISPPHLSRQVTASALPYLASPFIRTRPYMNDTSATKSQRTTVNTGKESGHLPYASLSRQEAISRTTQKTFYLGIILLGLGLTGSVCLILYLEVFATNSKIAVFNRAADRVRHDVVCQQILNGKSQSGSATILAYGEPTWSRWARNRTIASRLETDAARNEHLHMRFYVEGARARGTVNLHMVRLRESREFQYRSLTLDVPGIPRYHLENARAHDTDEGGKFRIFGIQWR